MSSTVACLWTRLDSTVLTARRQRTGTTEGEDTSPRTHSPSRPTRSHHTHSSSSHARLRLDTHNG
eukprot:4108393-Prymnesium_polylepis.1